MHKGREQLDPHEMTSEPPVGCDLKVGDIATFTNDYGVEFEGQEVVGFTLPGNELHGRTVYTKGDAFWFPSSPESLIKEVMMNFDGENFDGPEVATAIARFLPEYEPNLDRSGGMNGTLDHVSGDGRQLFINCQDRKKLEINISWPGLGGGCLDFKPDGVDSSCGVGRKRGPEEWARDMTRKLLPGYDEWYPRMLVKLLETKQHEADQLELKRRLVVDVLGGQISDHMKTSTQSHPYRHGVSELRVSGDTVELKTDYLPLEVAECVLEVLKRMMPKK